MLRVCARPCVRSPFLSQLGRSKCSLVASVLRAQSTSDAHPPDPDNWLHRQLRSKTSMTTPLHGHQLLQQPWLNKGLSFTDRERDRLGLRGLLPPRHLTLETQIARVYQTFCELGPPPSATPSQIKYSNIQRYLFLVSCHDRNEILYFATLTKHLPEMAPIVYTPTVGDACQKASALFRRSRGMYFTRNDAGDMRAILENWPASSVDVIVVTDGSRILGLGDLGAHGMGIPIGKLSLYVAAGGIHPTRVLPVLIDVGTDNAELLASPLYLGARHTRVRGPHYYELIDEFMIAVKDKWPKAVIQFEDFETTHAHSLLARYRHNFISFNDDIQGTGSVALAGLLTAMRLQHLPVEALADQRIVCVGAGSAGTGVCSTIAMAVSQFRKAAGGVKSQEPMFWMLDKDGLLTSKRSSLTESQRVFAQDGPEHEGETLQQVVARVKPHVLLGLSGAGPVFTEDVVREMARHVKHPIILALSNPTSLAECSPSDAMKWTDGRALYASGSPFPPFTMPNGDVMVASQSNNMYVFPGIGLGSIVSGTKEITDEMFLAAARALAECLSSEEMRVRHMYPNLKRIRDVSKRIAVAVCEVAVAQGLATHTPGQGGWRQMVEDNFWEPEYYNIISETSHHDVVT